jgi:hypothetical protein
MWRVDSIINIVLVVEHERMFCCILTVPVFWSSLITDKVERMCEKEGALFGAIYK